MEGEGGLEAYGTLGGAIKKVKGEGWRCEL